MRSIFCSEIIRQCVDNKDFIFITGDLGYKNLELLKDALGDRFINAGVAEQNMISVAAALAKEGLRPWIYSIAPFCFARPFEQIRNDICLHNLPVVIVGNGGGFGYGVMGPTHHAIEDYGVMLALQHMQVLLPAFSEDIPHVVKTGLATKGPTYLRLGADEKPKDYKVSDYSQWRVIKDGSKNIIILAGAITGKLIKESQESFAETPHKIWCLSSLPLLDAEFPNELIDDFKNAENVIIMEEHVKQGSIASNIALHLLCKGITIKKFHSFSIKGYLSGLYGNQQFHRDENNLNLESIFKCLEIS